MQVGLRFLIAARKCEIQDLAYTLQASELVASLTDTVHALQKERGLSIGFLASGGQMFAQALRQQKQQCQACETGLRQQFDQLLNPQDGVWPHGSRLYSRVAFVLQRLAGLESLRLAIEALQITQEAATDYLSGTIAGLLSVVIEAVDSRSLGSGHADIARLLLALFNLSQGKEYAGQERAWGTAFFAGNAASTAALGPHWGNLVTQQESCLALFAEFATHSQKQVLSDALLASQVGRQATETHLKHLRLQARQAPDSALTDESFSKAWFDCCTRRMDAIKLTEDHLSGELLALCRHKLHSVQAELREQESMMNHFDGGASLGSSASITAPIQQPTYPQTPYGPQLERFVLEMLAQQSQRLETMEKELVGVQAALSERKVVERAKGLLMERHRFSEAEAYGWMRQTAMNQGRRLGEVALNLLVLVHKNPAP